MKRGDIVTVAASGDYGKPRPAVVIQANWIDDTDSVLVCQITSSQRDPLIYRFRIEPGAETGLRGLSYAMADKILAIRRTKCGRVIGRIPDASMMRCV